MAIKFSNFDALLRDLSLEKKIDENAKNINRVFFELSKFSSVAPHQNSPMEITFSVKDPIVFNNKSESGVTITSTNNSTIKSASDIKMDTTANINSKSESNINSRAEVKSESNINSRAEVTSKNESNLTSRSEINSKSEIISRSEIRHPEPVDTSEPMDQDGILGGFEQVFEWAKANLFSSS